MSSKFIHTIKRRIGARIPALVVVVCVAAILPVLCLQVARAADGYDGRDAGSSNEKPKALDNVGIDEHLGGNVDLGLKFKNERGETVTLSSFTAGGKPLLLSLAYYGCPGLCNFHLNGLKDAFKQMSAPLGREFQVVVVSIEPKETPQIATLKRDAYIEAYGRPEGAQGWHFLVGDEVNVHKLAEQVGFKYAWDAQSNQWAHASAAFILTPDGRISRNFYGITFNPKDLRLSLIEASNGTIGTVIDQLVLFCFHYDPKASKYTIAAFNVMRAGGGLAVLVMAGFMIPFWWRSRKDSQGES
jgi:protein SCO1/2